jgi:hypothetical protein
VACWDTCLNVNSDYLEVWCVPFATHICHAYIEVWIKFSASGGLLPYFFKLFCMYIGGTRWCSLLRHCATSRKVVGSIPNGVIGIFHWLNPSWRTIALGSSQPLTEMSTRNTSRGGGLRRPVRSADNRTTFMCRLSRNLGASPTGTLRVCSGLYRACLYMSVYIYV